MGCKQICYRKKNNWWRCSVICMKRHKDKGKETCLRAWLPVYQCTVWIINCTLNFTTKREIYDRSSSRGCLCHFLCRPCPVASAWQLLDCLAWIQDNFPHPSSPTRSSNNGLIIKNSPHVFISEESIALLGSCQYLFSSLSCFLILSFMETLTLRPIALSTYPWKSHDSKVNIRASPHTPAPLSF